MQRKAVIAGGSGFLGQALARDLTTRGWAVTILSRSGGSNSVLWDGKTLSNWALALEDAEVIVNLTGKNIASVHNEPNRKQILESRLDSVRALGAALRAATRPPQVWLQASALAIYGNPGAVICDETTPPAATGNFLTETTKAWEAVFASESVPSLVRKVTLRTGIVLGKNGGALQPLEKLTKAFLGGSAGDGQQYMSWIHLDDYCAVCRWAVDQAEAAGPYNVCAPAPVTNEVFMRELRHLLHRPWSPPAPAWAVKFGAEFIMRADPSVILTGQRALPRRLEEAGFHFSHIDLRETLAELIG